MTTDPALTIAMPERIAIFVDFWNFELSTKAEAHDFKTDWLKMPSVLFTAATKLLSPALGSNFVGMHVFGSYGTRDTKLHDWATNTLSRFPGISATFLPRRKQVSGPKCPSCHAEITVCPVLGCGSSMLGEKEKGVDTLLATDMIRMAWENIYDSAVLITADEDLVPTVKFLNTKGKRIILGQFPPKGAVLSSNCWGTLNIPNYMPVFSR